MTPLLNPCNVQINKTYSLYAAAGVSRVEAFRPILRFLTKKASFTNVELTSTDEGLLTVLAKEWIPSGLRNVCLHAIGDELANGDSLLNFLNTVKPSEFKLGKYSARKLPPTFFAHSAWKTVTKLEIEIGPIWNLKCTFGDEHLHAMTNLRQLDFGNVFTQLTASGLLKWTFGHFQANTDVILLSRVSSQVVRNIRSYGAAFIVNHFAHKFYQEIQRRNEVCLLECVQGNYKLQIGQVPPSHNRRALIRKSAATTRWTSHFRNQNFPQAWCSEQQLVDGHAYRWSKTTSLGSNIGPMRLCCGLAFTARL